MGWVIGVLAGIAFFAYIVRCVNLAKAEGQRIRQAASLEVARFLGVLGDNYEAFQAAVKADDWSAASTALEKAVAAVYCLRRLGTREANEALGQLDAGGVFDNLLMAKEILEATRPKEQEALEPQSQQWADLEDLEARRYS